MIDLANFVKHPLQGFHDGSFLGYRYYQSELQVVVFVVDADGCEFCLRATNVISIDGVVKELASSIYEIQHEQTSDLSKIKILTNMATDITIEFKGDLECFKKV